MTSVGTKLRHTCDFPGNYFASHFIMGGERFDASQPEAYLFGENSDLNFLGSRPMPFPYPAPQPNEPTRPLRCLINIRKESLRFIRFVLIIPSLTLMVGFTVNDDSLCITSDRCLPGIVRCLDWSSILNE